MTQDVAYKSVWDALIDDPVEQANMKLRSAVLSALNDEVRSWGLTQADAARRLGVVQLRVNHLLRGKIAEFSLDALIELSTRAGLEFEIHVKRAE